MGPKDIPDEMRGHAPSEPYPGAPLTWRYADELALHRGCKPDYACWMECRDVAVEDLAED
jgi:hypothetical protein